MINYLHTVEQSLKNLYKGVHSEITVGKSKWNYKKCSSKLEGDIKKKSKNRENRKQKPSPNLMNNYVKFKFDLNILIKR